MAAISFQEIKAQLRELYAQDERPWLAGFSGGKDSTMVASLVFDAVLSVPPGQRKKPVAILCTDTRVEIPAVAEGVESALERMRRCSQHNPVSLLDRPGDEILIGRCLARLMRIPFPNGSFGPNHA